MIRSRNSGHASELTDNGDFAVLGAGARLIAQNMGMGGLKNIGSDMFRQKERGEDDEAEEDDFGEEDENQDDGFEELLAPDKDEDEAPDDEGEGLEDDDALLTFTGATGAVLDKLGLRRKTFMCDIHHVRLTNLGRRRRDVQVIFTLGAGPGEGGAVTLKDVLPSTNSTNTVSDSAPSLAIEDAAGEAVEGEVPAADGSPAAGRLSRLAGVQGRRGRHKATAESSETSRPMVFKTDVAAKVERGRTATLKRKFHGRWTGKYRDLYGVARTRTYTLATLLMRASSGCHSTVLTGCCT